MADGAPVVVAGRVDVDPPALRGLGLADIGGPQQPEGEDSHADDDCRIGEVEHGPDRYVDEVHHVAEPQSVDQISHRSAELETESQIQHAAGNREVAVAGQNDAY